VAIVDSFNQKTGRCDPSLGRIAHLLGIHRRTVIRASKSLQALRVLIVDRHGGNHHCNSYQPNWALFREIEKRWAAVKKTSHYDKAGSNLSPLPVSAECHSAGDQAVTQTNPTNHSNLTLGPSRAAGHNVKPAELSGPKRQPRKPTWQRPFASSNLPAFSAARTAARGAAEKRWNKDLQDQFIKYPDRYAEIIQAIDGQLQEAATDAEMGKYGAGVAYLIEELRRRQLEP
jgi:hypothetical protein